MQKKTAYAVVSILGQVEVMLRNGRPRKPLNGRRPEATLTALSKPKVVMHVSKRISWLNLDQVSLVGAFKIIAAADEYNRYQIDVARHQVEWAYGDRGHWKHWGGWPSIETIDADQWDTREIRRTCRSAAQTIEQYYLS